MKKFLTVLLALSVVFTYTVGTAFAANGVRINAKADEPTYTLSEVESAIYAQAQKNVGMLDAVKSNFMTNYDVNKVVINGVTYSKEAVQKVIDKVFSDIAANINTVADAKKEHALKESQKAGTPAGATYASTETWAAGLYIKTSDAPEIYEPATADNAFQTPDQTITAANFDASKTNLYTNAGGTVTKVDAATGSFSADATYLVKKAGVTWYTKTPTAEVPGFRGHFTKGEKEAYEKAINDEYLKYDTAAEIQSFIEGDYTDVQTEPAKYEKDLLTAEHAVQKAEIVALIDKVDLNKYSAEVKNTEKYLLTAAKAAEYFLSGKGYYSYQERAKSVIAKAKAELAKKDIIPSDGTTEIKAKYTAIADETTFFAAYKTLIDGIPTMQEEQWDKEDLAKGQERITSAMKARLAELKGQEYDKQSKTIRDLEKKEAQGTTLTAAEKQQLKEAKEALAALDKDYAAVEEVYANQISAYTLEAVKEFFDANGILKNDKITSTFTVDTAKKTLAAAKLAKVAELKAEADTLLKMTGLDGALMYDKTAVEDALEKAVQEAYDAANKTALDDVDLSVVPNYDVVKAEMNKVLTNDDAIEFNKKFYPSVKNWTAAGYDEDKTKEVKAVIEATREAVRAAKTVEAVDEAFLAGYTKYDAIPSLQDREDAQTEKAYTDKIAEYTTELKILINAKAERMGGEAKFTAAYGIAPTALLTNLVGTNGAVDGANTGLYAAYTVEEMKAAYDAAVAAVNGLKTTADLDAEVAALNKAIGEVKAPVTAAAKATVLSLNKQVKELTEYAAITGYNTGALRTTLLESLTDGIMAIDAKEVRDAAASIMKDGKVSLDEKEAVNAVIALVDAYAENYGEAAKAALIAGDVATVCSHDFKLQEIKAVEDAIAVIDATAKPLDVKAIEAARAAYDALAEEGLAVDPKLYAKLLGLENSLDEYNKYLKVGVQGTTIKIYSKAYKGYNKISWKKSLGFKVDGYEVYRATKKNGKFKKIWTAKSTGKSVKNTLNLISGKRYYYYAKGFRMIDGEKVYTKKSITIYRTAK